MNIPSESFLRLGELMIKYNNPLYIFELEMTNKTEQRNLIIAQIELLKQEIINIQIQTQIYTKQINSNTQRRFTLTTLYKNNKNNKYTEIVNRLNEKLEFTNFCLKKLNENLLEM
jgi:hypothetical protein